MNRRLVRMLKGAAVPVLLVVLWYAAAAQGWLEAGLLPGPQQVWRSFQHLAERGLLGQHIRDSLLRVLVGFGWAAVLGIPIGITLGWVRPLRPWLMPMLHFLRQIPPVAWIPLFLLWFGLGEASKHAVIVYAAFFPIFLNTVLGVEQIPRPLWEVSRVLEFSTLRNLLLLVLPGSAPAVAAGLRLGLGMSWRALVAAEMLAASSGLGYLIMSARSLVRTDDMVVGMLLIGIIGLSMEQLFSAAEQKLLPWRRSALSLGGGEDTGTGGIETSSETISRPPSSGGCGQR